MGRASTAGRLERRSSAAAGLGLTLGLTLAGPAWGAPPASRDAEESAAGSELEPEVALELGVLEGRVLEAGGSRQPVSGAAVLVVAAPPQARPGKPARDPLDPASVTWVRQAETDAEGRFRVEQVPLGKLRVVVVAGGYARLEQWEQLPRARALQLYLELERGSGYRTEVRSERAQLAEPDHELRGEQARRYAGAGDDPVLAALNLPGVARSPGGLGLLSLRGGNPTQTGIYVDGHPVPRAFHVLPIASVLSAPMSDRVELHPGAYAPSYGGFSSGLLHLHSRAGRREGIHGQAHVDLIDLGITSEAPVGPGSVHVGFRRSHVDGVVEGAEGILGPTNLLLPTYWDYLARLDLPVARGQRLTLRALGAGDRLRAKLPPEFAGGRDPRSDLFEFAASFHRFDLDYRRDAGQWRLLLSPSLRLDSSRIEQNFLVRRDAVVVSLRAEAQTALLDWLELHVGGDLVHERWRRRERVLQALAVDPFDPSQIASELAFQGTQLRAGMWAATRLHGERWSLTPSLRLNTFHYAGRTFVRPDPRIEGRGRVHARVELFAKLGLFSVPLVVSSGSADANLINPDGEFFGGVADVPPYLITYFDPGVEGELREGSSGVSYATQASAGVELELPWELRGRVTGFWRELAGTTVPVYFADNLSVELSSRQQRSYGMELLVRRELGPVDGWIGYTLLAARERRGEDPWGPATFDQRHNLVLLLSAALPRGFRVGLRFRLVSGNPLATVLGGERVTTAYGSFYLPIRAPLGHSYQPLFHQLDVRVDKRWSLRRIAVTAYLDVQNIYDRRYPEIYVYTQDWSQRESLIGLPIFPSLGVQLDY